MQVTALNDGKGTIIDLGEAGFVRPNDEGIWQTCSEAEAIAIAVKGSLYEIMGQPLDTYPVGNWAYEDPDNPDSPVLEAYVYESELTSLTVDILAEAAAREREISDAELAITEVYEGQGILSEQTTETQIALAEVYESQASLADQITEIQIAMTEQYENGGVQ